MEKDIIPKEIGTFSWSCNDDEGQLHTNKLNTIIYFPDKPVNILSASTLSESMKDDEVTWVPTKRKYSILLRFWASTKRQ